MKKYIGTKEVEAHPMSAEEAKIKGLKSPYDEGYKVFYQDSLPQWIPKEIFEKTYSPTCSTLDKLYFEHNYLLGKYNDLEFFKVDDDMDFRLDSLQEDLMEKQKNILKDYLLILRTRIELIKK